MTRFTAITLLILAASLLVSCGGSQPDAGPEIIAIEDDPDLAPFPTDTSDSQAGQPGIDPATAALIAKGDTTFNTGFCQKCHQTGGVGGERAPDLTDSEWVHCDGTVEGIAKVINSGVPKDKLVNKSYPFNMRAASGMQLSEADVQALAAYVHSLGQ
jgi:mono/diheme cytochrome c family protein